MGKKVGCYCVLGLIFVMPGGVTQAFELTADAYTDIEYSDNVRRERRDRLAESTQLFGLGLGVKNESQLLDLFADISFEKEVYYEGVITGGNDTLATGYAEMDLELIESFLSWGADATRREFLNDPLADDVPDNLVYRDVIRTGPRVEYQLNRTTSIALVSNYVSIENSDSDVADSNRTENRLTFYHLYNRSTTFDLAGSYDNVLKAEGREQLEDYGVTVGVNRTISGGELSLSAGRTLIKPEFSEQLGSTTIELEISKRNVFFHDIELAYKLDTSDNSIGFLVDENSSAEDGTRLFDATENDIVETETLSLSFARDFSSFNYNIEFFFDYEDYLRLGNDERSRGVRISSQHRLASKLSLNYDYEYELRYFVDQPEVLGKEKTHELESSFRYDLTADFYVGAGLNYAVRKAGANPLRDFEELAISLSMNWTLL